MVLVVGQLRVQQQPGHADHPVQGRADLVAHVRQELALGDAGRLGPERQLVGPDRRRLEIADGPLEFAFGGHARGDVAETPHPADDLGADPLGLGVSLEDAGVLQLQHVGAGRFRLVVELAHLANERLGVLELVEDESERRVVVAGGEDFRGDAPHLDEFRVAPDDPALAVDHEDAVGGGLHRGFQDGQRLRDGRLRLPALADLAGELVARHRCFLQVGRQLVETVDQKSELAVGPDVEPADQPVVRHAPRRRDQQGQGPGDHSRHEPYRADGESHDDGRAPQHVGEGGVPSLGDRFRRDAESQGEQRLAARHHFEVVPDDEQIAIDAAGRAGTRR